MLALSPGDRLEAIDAVVRAALAGQHLPGLSLAVAHGGDVVLARGYGQRNVGEGLAADADTIYSIASISKQFTAAAIMQLAERGLLHVDDRVKRYFPWLACDEAAELRHLLTHTSGIRDYFPLEELDRIGMSAATPREIAEFATAGGGAFAPGAEYQYSNTGYVLLGAVIEHVSGLRYAEYLAGEFFGPLGMTRTGVDDSPVIRENVAVGHTSFVLGPWELARDYHPDWEFATGGLYSTVRDMLTWNHALRAGRVVRPASLAQMTTPALLTDGHPVNYGFGLAVSTIGGISELRHTGGLPGISTDNAAYPDLGIDIVVCVNHDACSTYATITRPILALLTGNPRLRGGRPNDLRASSGLNERPAAHDWIRAAAAGDIEALPFSAKFERFLRPDRRARFRELRAFGKVTEIRLIDANRRDPETNFTYCVDFERTRLLAMIGIRDDGALVNLNFGRWDDRG